MDLAQSSLNIVAIGLLSMISLYLFLFHCSKASRDKEAPMVDSVWPVLGHLPLLSGSRATHHLFGAIANKYGPFFTIKFGYAQALVINNWEIVKEYYTTNDLVVSYHPNLVAIEKMTYNQATFGFAPYGPYWHEMCKIITLGFLSNHRVDLLSHNCVSKVQTSVKELFDVWSHKKDKSNFLLVELKQWFHELAFNTSLQMVAGKRYFRETAVVNEEKAQRCLKALSVTLY